MAHMTTQQPESGWFYVTLEIDGDLAHTPEQAMRAMDELFPGVDLAIDPARPWEDSQGDWHVELPGKVAGILDTQGFLDLGGHHPTAARLQAEAH